MKVGTPVCASADLLNKSTELNASMSDFSDYAKDLQESNGDIDAVVSEGLKNLKETISQVKVELPKTPAQKSVEAKTHVTNTADSVVDSIVPRLSRFVNLKLV